MNGRNGNERMDLTGDRYGNLTVLGPAPDAGGRPVWRCKCDCGNETNVRANNLRSGRTRSCGCLPAELRKASRADLTGQTFSRLTALEPAGHLGRDTAWRCQCSCGKEAVVRTRDLRYGRVRSCGCLRKHTRKGQGDLDGKKGATIDG